MLIDQCLPRFDGVESDSIDVDAGWQATYSAIRRADLDDSVLNRLPVLPAMPPRPAGHAPGELTLDTLLQDGTAWIVLAEVPGIELVVGSVGPFWSKGNRTMTGSNFLRFREPGHVKFAVSFTVVPRGPLGATLRCDVRASATDDASRKWLRRYWTLVRPGAGLFVKRVLRLIKSEAERPIKN